jgi:hypothetical protein
MRMTAPALGGLAIAVAMALVWAFRPEPELEPQRSDVVKDVTAPAPRMRAPQPVVPQAAPETRASTRPSAEERVAESDTTPPLPPAAPLPGQLPATPMAQLLADREKEFPPQLAEGEREFAAEPVDASWAPGAEADVLAKFAQMPGLKLIDLQVECRSTMCRLQVTQPSGAPDANGARPFNILLDSIGYEPRWMMAIGDRSGPMRSIAYLWRDGFAPERPSDRPQEHN